MKEFYIDFSSYVVVIAENELEAKREFWKWVEKTLGIAEIDRVKENIYFENK